MKTLLQILDEVLAERPEYQPAVELILKKIDERVDADLAFARNFARTHPGSTRTQ
jgi:hypothetical protein